jgi:hypothetical protein
MATRVVYCVDFIVELKIIMAKLIENIIELYNMRWGYECNKTDGNKLGY